ncbi:SAM-dependent methyltransferase [Stieleria marina]
MSKYLSALRVKDGNRVVDFGCGCGELIIRLCECSDIVATGIDSSQPHLAEARRRAARRINGAQIQFVEANAAEFTVDESPIDIAICMGSSHAFGLGPDSFANALSKIIPMLAPGGQILIGEGYMKQPASPEYRAMLGDSSPDSMTHARNVQTAKQLGLIPLAAWTSSEEEWDDFEWGYQQIVEHNAAEDPNNQTAADRLSARREWMDAYLRWGRDTLGYGIYLLKNPA